jgi:hypothetical protein
MIVIIINFIFCPNIIYFCSVKLDFSGKGWEKVKRSERCNIVRKQNSIHRLIKKKYLCGKIVVLLSKIKTEPWWRVKCNILTDIAPFTAFDFFSPLSTVVKELWSKMFGQHPGYFKAIFLKQTQDNYRKYL